MAVLVFEHEGVRRGGQLPARVLVGRRSMNHFVVDHRAVSRIHAWIGADENGFFIRDANSRTGTQVNGEKVTARHLLDGDAITIGPATLTFLAADELPDDVEPIDLASDPTIAPEERGVLFDCSCGAPLWASLDYVGHQGQCTYCGQPIKVPAPHAPRPGNLKPKTNGRPARVVEARQRTAATPARPAAATAPARARQATQRAIRPASRPAERATEVTPHAAEICGVCQSPIATFEAHTRCPDCGLVFHTECWEENYGCSAYGCAQVNALRPPEAADASQQTQTPADYEYEDEAPPAFPWEFVLLAASVFGVLVSAVTFGVPSLIAAVVAVVYFLRNRGQGRTAVVLASAALGVIGVATGVAVSFLVYHR